jgi:hypothetical protein
MRGKHANTVFGTASSITRYNTHHDTLVFDTSVMMGYVNIGSW